jgi:beta-lactamase regulating signal transducer with metallopeptidase domain
MGTLLELGLSNAVLASVLAVVAAGVGQVCRRPAVVHSLWLLVLLKLVTPPLIPAPFSLGIPADAAVTDDPPGPVAEHPSQHQTPEPREGADGDEPFIDVQYLPSETARLAPAETETLPSGLSWPAIVGPLWLAGSLVWSLWVVLHVYRFQRLLGHAKPAGAELIGLVRTLAGRLGLKRYPSVWLVPGAVSPMLWTVGRAPRLLFPARLLERLDREQLQTLLVHELAHMRRRDHWVRFVELAALGLYWWHPVLWWARRELHEAEEQCCDAWVVWTLAGTGRAYALALLQTVAFFSQVRAPLPVAASGIGLVPHLRRRLTMIMQGKTQRSLSWAGGLAVLGLGVVLLPLSVQAQAPVPQVRPNDAKGSRQEKIEILKKAIQILEEQEKAERKKTPEPKKESPEVGKVLTEAKAAAAEVEAKRRELLKAQAKLDQILRRLAELQGKDYRNPDFVRPHLPSVGQAPDGARFGKYPPGPVKPKPKDKTPTELEQKFDRLLREVEELRRELRRDRPTTGQYGPGGPKKVPSDSGPSKPDLKAVPPSAR